MSTACRYMEGRIVKIDFDNLSANLSIDTKNKYTLILIEKGNLNLRINDTNYSYLAPCLVRIRENVEIEILSQDMLIGKLISFDVSFLNINITYDFINSGAYERKLAEYGYVPLNMFSDRKPNFFGCLPLETDTITTFKEHFSQIEHIIANQPDIRWSCRARLHLNLMLEQAHQIYLHYIKNKTEYYNIKDPNSWVSIILDKIHNDYKSEISLNTVSDYIKINKTTVAKHFKTITGYSVTDYIIHYRIKCACYALATTEISIKEIATECGFNHESYFIRQFTAKIGISPREYRKQIVAKRKKDFQNK